MCDKRDGKEIKDIPPEEIFYCPHFKTFKEIKTRI
jgi:leucyl aminopeptidase (aminopeptidase T)